MVDTYLQPRLKVGGGVAKNEIISQIGLQAWNQQRPHLCFRLFAGLQHWCMTHIAMPRTRCFPHAQTYIWAVNGWIWAEKKGESFDLFKGPEQVGCVAAARYEWSIYCWLLTSGLFYNLKCKLNATKQKCTSHYLLAFWPSTFTRSRNMSDGWKKQMAGNFE